MSYRQFRFRLPWQSVKASSHPADESSRRSSEPTDETKASSSVADTVPNIRHQPGQSPEIKPEQPPLAPAQAAEKSETMPPSKSHKEAKVHAQPPSHSRAKNQTRTASKPPSPSKAIPQSSVALNKSPSASGKASPYHDTSKPSSPAGKASPSSKPSSPASKASPSQNTSKPSSLAGKASPSKDASKPSSLAGKASPSKDASKPSSPAGKASPSQDASKPSSPAAPRSRIASKPPSPSQTSSKNHPNSKPTSQSRLKADSQPQVSSMPRSPSQENSRQQRSKKTSRVQSPSHLSSKPIAQSTSPQHTKSPAAIGDQTTKEIVSHPANQSPQARPRSRESQLETKSKQSPKPDSKPVESKASKDEPETNEEPTLTSKNTSHPHSNQDSSEIPMQPNQTIENGPEPSLESQEESKENKERKNDKEDQARTINALQTSASKSTWITSSESPSPFEQADKDSKQEETMEDLSKAFQKLNIKYSDEENPKSFTTLIGDNKGASMHVHSGEAKRESSIHIHREYKSDPDQSPESSTDDEGNFNHETPQESRTEEDPPLELYININVQGINNSILSNTSFTENNPGIKLKFVREPTRSEDELQSHDAREAKYTAKPAERLTYEPTVRRRCLRGLLMESSDSELDDPEKPRRHGCRYSRSCEGKEVEIL